jgi:hypothetical protein
VEEAEQEGKRLSWATRSLRRLKARITKVGGKKDQPKEQEWQLEDAAQWELLFQGKEVFWKAAGAIRAEGYDSIYSLTQDANDGNRGDVICTVEQVKELIARKATAEDWIACNVKATVGQHFLFHEPIPKAINGQGYLRVTTKSLWWQHEQFPKVWTAEGFSTCSENGYQWTVKSTTWNHQ